VNISNVFSNRKFLSSNSNSCKKVYLYEISLKKHLEKRHNLSEVNLRSFIQNKSAVKQAAPLKSSTDDTRFIAQFASFYDPHATGNLMPQHQQPQTFDYPPFKSY
jgi:hypothetical protein